MTDTVTIQMIDVRSPDNVEIQFSPDGETLWVNVDGICRLRVKGLAVRDARQLLFHELTLTYPSTEPSR